MSTLQDNGPSTMKAVLLVLGDIRRQTQLSPSSTGTSTLRLAVTCLRIASVLVAKLGAIVIVEIQDLAVNVRHYVHFGSTAPRPSSQAATRRDPSTFANDYSSFGKGHFLGTIPAPTPRSRSRRPSVDSLATSASMSAAEAETSDDIEARRQEMAQIRLDALSCLRSVAQIDSGKPLYPFWQMFLPISTTDRATAPTLMHLVEADESTAVRLRACETVRDMLEPAGPYLSIALETLGFHHRSRMAPTDKLRR